MADYRQIHTSIWDDVWFCQLSCTEKIIFVWLFSNRRASVSGIYKFSEFICSRETGLSQEDVRDAVQKLSQDKKIYIEGEWIWVKNLRKYNDSKSPNSYKSIAKDLQQLPDNGLRRAYLEYYQETGSPLPTPSKPLTGDIDVPLEQEHEQEKEKESLIINDFLSRFDVLTGCMYGGISDRESAEEMIKEFGLERVTRAAYWVKEKTPSTMRTAIKSMNTALRNGGFHDEKPNGNGHKSNPKDLRDTELRLSNGNQT